MALAIWGVPNPSKPGTKSEVAHKWAWWRNNPCRLGGPQHFTAGENITSGPPMGVVALRGPQHFKVGDKIRSGPRMSVVAT